MTDASILPDRFARFAEFTLSKGSHNPPNDPGDPGEMCGMELVSWLAGEPFSDHPQCTCPIIAAFVRSWQDNLPDDKRQLLIKPLIPKLIGTRGNADVERRRVIMINDWLIRVDTPAWLRLAGLDAQAAALESLPEITDFETTPPLRAALEAAQRDAEAAAWAA